MECDSEIHHEVKDKATWKFPSIQFLATPPHSELKNDSDYEQGKVGLSQGLQK